jgi:hypothetical protein
MEALRYSRRLVRDQWWRIFGIYLLLFAVVAGVAIALGLTLGIAGSIIEMVTSVGAVKYLSSLVGPALYPFIWSVYVVLFLNEDAVLHGVDAGAVRPGEAAVADVPAEAERDHAGS